MSDALMGMIKLEPERAKMSIMQRDVAISTVREVFSAETVGFNSDKIEQMARMVEGGIAVVYCEAVGEGGRDYVFLRLFRDPCIAECYRYDEVSVDCNGNVLSFHCDALVYPY